VGVIHGDRSQGQRERALGDFKRGRVDVLVATDIASRGIDVDDITHVVNFDVPRAPEDYVHRIGRTGRMNAAGDALTLVSPEEEKDAHAIERFLGRKIPHETLPGFNYQARATKSTHGSDGDRPHGRGSDRERGHDRGSHADSRRGGRDSKPGRESQVPAGSSSGPAHGRRRQLNSTDRRSRRRM
jgi:ATP-dependent RNA helicase RhlE